MRAPPTRFPRLRGRGIGSGLFRAPGALLLLGPLGLLGLTGCASGPNHYLADYDFSVGTLAVVYGAEPTPEVRMGGPTFNSNPLQMVLEAGSHKQAREQAEELQPKMVEAAASIEFAPRLAERTGARVSRSLGTRPVESEFEADYLLELELDGVGIDLRSDDLSLFIDGLATLIHRETGRQIWYSFIGTYSPLDEALTEVPVVERILGLEDFSELTTEDFEALLPPLVDYAADQIVEHLRRDLQEVREGD